MVKELPKDLHRHPACVAALREAVEVAHVRALALLSFDATEGADDGTWLAVSGLERELRAKLAEGAPSAVEDVRTVAAGIRKAALDGAVVVCDGRERSMRDWLAEFGAVTPESACQTAVVKAETAANIARRIRALARDTDVLGGGMR